MEFLDIARIEQIEIDQPGNEEDAFGRAKTAIEETIIEAFKQGVEMSNCFAMKSRSNQYRSIKNSRDFLELLDQCDMRLQFEQNRIDDQRIAIAAHRQEIQKEIDENEDSDAEFVDLFVEDPMPMEIIDLSDYDDICKKSTLVSTPEDAEVWLGVKCFVKVQPIAEVQTPKIQRPHQPQYQEPTRQSARKKALPKRFR